MAFECQAFSSMRIPRMPLKLLVEFEVETDRKCIFRHSWHFEFKERVKVRNSFDIICVSWGQRSV